MPNYLDPAYFEKKGKKGRAKRAKKAPKKFKRYDPESDEFVYLTKDDPAWDTTETPAKGTSARTKASKLSQDSSPTSGDSWIDTLGKDIGKDVAKDLLKKKRQPRTRAAKAQAAKDAAALGNAGKALLEIGKTNVGQLVKTGGALAIGSTAALAILAGVGSYYATTWVMNKLAEAREAKTPAAIRYHAAMAYRQARIDAAEKLKRPLNAAEQRYLGDQFKAKLKTIGG